ncbi:MAG: energy-coupling factor ABC transporter permease [Nitriliruptoraceae bacterium]
MHAPDGFLTAPTALATGIVSAGAIAGAVRASRPALDDDRIPLAGVTAAFIFAAQMVNFPVAAGTTGHLIGAALAAVLLGPSLAMLVVAIVVAVQALVFADGGLTALGYNVLNMAIVPTLGGWAVFVGTQRLLRRSSRAVAVSAGIAGFASVVLSAAAFSLEWLVGASVAVPFDRVVTAMVGVHVLIGIGEAVITAAVVAAVMAVRVDLVAGAQRYGDRLDLPRGGGRRVALAGLVAALAIGAGVAQFAVDAPDGLERVAQDLGFAESGQPHPFASSLFSEYATQGIASPSLSLAVAGVAGTLLTATVGTGVVLLIRDRPRRDTQRSEPSNRAG